MKGQTIILMGFNLQHKNFWKKETENEREMDDRNDLEKTLEGHQ